MDTLKDPSKATEKAPDAFKVKFATTKGDFTLEITRAWSPLGADRLVSTTEGPGSLRHPAVAEVVGQLGYTPMTLSRAGAAIVDA